VKGFGMKFLAILMAFGWLVISDSTQAEDFAYEEGTHYVALEIPIKTRNPSKIEVAEYFSYGCPHCYDFEPLIGAWQASLPADVAFSRTPAVWNQDYQVYAQTYVTLEALGVLEKVHVAIFNAIHTDRLRLSKPQAMAQFLVKYGVDPEDFAKTYNSFGVRAALQQTDSKGRAYRSTGVPAIIVNGKYRIEGSMSRTNANMLRIASFLIEKERQLMAEVATP
jgi:thiol:disulfide interchange protein DsbA